MHGTRDDAVWKRLALALGDGLAFGVGVNLSNNATARITPRRPDMGTLADRLNGIEQRIEKARHNNMLPGAFQQRVVEAVVTVVDARLREQAAQFEKRMTDEIAALRGEMSQQLAVNRQIAAEDNDTLRSQMTELHRQFAASMARLVDEQIAATMELRLDREPPAPVRNEVAALQRRVGENDRDTLELVLAMGQLCLQTAERLSAAAAPAPKADPPKPLWRIPLVSSFFFVSCGLLLLHYL